MMYQVIEHVYTQLARLLRFNSWKQVPKGHACYVLAALFSETEIRQMLGFYGFNSYEVEPDIKIIAEVILSTKQRFEIHLAA